MTMARFNRCEVFLEEIEFRGVFILKIWVEVVQARLVELVRMIVESLKTMKTLNRAKIGGAFCRLIFSLMLFCSLAQASRAVGLLPPGDTNFPPEPIASWSFQDTNAWTSDQGYAPISFTNIAFSYLGNGSSLVVNTNVPAWLNFNVIEPTNGATNLVLNAPGSITFWFGPGWSSGTNGGIGPGQWAQLVSVGEWTSNSSYGYWGLSVDPSGSNVVFLSQDGLGDTYSLFAPIVSWTTNYFHSIMLTYSSTNVSIYMDGQLATNDPGGLSIWPSSAAISDGMFFGSETNGNEEAQGMFNSIETYNTVLNSNNVQEIYNLQLADYELSPWNVPYMDALSSAPSSPSTNYDDYDIITGSGDLQWVSSTTAISSSNVWITNEVVTMAGTNMSLQFTIQGGFDGYPYDTFVNSLLDFSSDTNKAWAWMGQGFHGNTYVITNLPNTTCFLILGTPQDSDGDGLTDAYERLVSKTDPYNADTSGDGISDSDKILEGLNPLGYYPQWMMDSDNDGLPDAYESANATAFDLNPDSAEAPPNLPAYTAVPVQ